MKLSDVITVAVVMISALSAYISYKNNKVNVLAKRIEIAIQKRLVVFGEIVGEIGKITTWTGYLAVPQVQTKEEAIERIYKYNGDIDFSPLYFKQRWLFPKHIDMEIRKFIDLLTGFTEDVIIPLGEQLDYKFDKASITKRHVDLRNKEDEIVKLIQDFVGL